MSLRSCSFTYARAHTRERDRVVRCSSRSRTAVLSRRVWRLLPSCACLFDDLQHRSSAKFLIYGPGNGAQVEPPHLANTVTDLADCHAANRLPIDAGEEEASPSNGASAPGISASSPSNSWKYRLISWVAGSSWNSIAWFTWAVSRVTSARRRTPCRDVEHISSPSTKGRLPPSRETSRRLIPENTIAPRRTAFSFHLRG